MKSKNYPLLFFVLWGCQAFAQGSLIPRGNPAYQIMDRLEIKSGLQAPYHSAVKYYDRGSVIKYALQLDTLQNRFSALDKADLRFIFRDNNEWLGQAAVATSLTGRRVAPCDDSTLTMPIASIRHPLYEKSKKSLFHVFYPTPANMIEANQPSFFLRVNPLVNFQYGNIKNDAQPYFINQRGFELRAGIDDRVFMYINLLDNQAQFPQYVRDRFLKYRSLPGAGLVKNYQNNLLKITNGYDFLLSDGGLGFNLSPHFGAQLGYGRNFIGNGYRSLMLSDFAFNSIYLKLNWKIWKFHFENIFSELSANSPNGSGQGSQLIDKKYSATHYLSINIKPNLTFGLFETVVFSRPNHFEFQYLNPIILYRTVEGALGSPDNELLGFDAKWNFKKHFQLYAQLVLDEFVTKELLVRPRGWWANKYSYQVGLKYVDALGVDHLDLQFEANVVRPYTYGHFDSLASSYTQVLQPLAHPLGSNFKELIFLARYQPIHRLVADFRLIHAYFGEDKLQQNWGGDVNRSNTTYVMTYGNKIGQGVPAQTTLIGLDVSYQLSHNVFADIQYFNRRKISDDPSRNQNTQYVSLGFRVNMGKLRMDY